MSRFALSICPPITDFSAPVLLQADTSYNLKYTLSYLPNILNPSCIIFDCDGVLVDSEKLENQVLIELIKPLGFEMTLDEAVSRFLGCKMADCITELESELGHTFPEDFVPMLRREMKVAFKRDLKPVSGIADALEKIKIPSCVASSGPPEKINLSLTITGLIEHFRGRIFSAYEINSWKPEPDLFLHAAKTMGHEPANCIVVEDSPLGVQAGVAAGMRVLGYAEIGNGNDLAKLGATVFHSMRELPELISG